MKPIEALFFFLQCPLFSTTEIFDVFRKASGVIFRERSPQGKERFLFIPGSRKNKVVLVAHADTFWDHCYGYRRAVEHIVYEQEGYLFARDSNGNPSLLGADDRSGIAILYLLRNSGHSVLITDGEERKQAGSTYLVENCKDVAAFISDQHQFLLQFDQQHYQYVKYYSATPEIKQYISLHTGYKEALSGSNSYTDLSVLCQNLRLCGVNLTPGYTNLHTVNESLNIEEWLRTYNLVKTLLANDCPDLTLKNNRYNEGK